MDTNVRASFSYRSTIAIPQYPSASPLLWTNKACLARHSCIGAETRGREEGGRAGGGGGSVGPGCFTPREFGRCQRTAWAWVQRMRRCANEVTVGIE